jgi:ribosomal protein S18 acetylase RimI-like enzyme
VTAAALRRSVPERGLRPVDPRADMMGMAELIEVAFAERLDEGGRRMVRSMRAFGRWGWLGWALGHLFLPPAAYPEGYVWIEGGRLVGNASLMRADLGSKRWVLINVAVAPAFRRKGIAGAMVEACLEDTRRHGAGEVLLQVDADNHGAQELYRRLGFRLTAVRGTWSRKRPRPMASHDFPARRRRPGEAGDQLTLAKAVCPEGLLWPRPLDTDVFRRSFAWGTGAHWVWPTEGPMRAFLSAFPGYETTEMHLILAVSPTAIGRAEAPLLDLALADIPFRSGEIRLEAAGEVDEAVLREQGFELGRKLAWMATRLGPTPTTLADGVGDLRV